MKKILPLASACLALSGGFASAVSLLLDFGNPDPNATGGNVNAGPVAVDQYLTLSPGHDSGAVPLGHTSWNTITSAAARTDLVFGDGSTAAGVTLTLGQETTTNTITYNSRIGNTTLIGTSGGANYGSPTIAAAGLLHHNVPGFSGSIYGDDRATSTAVGRDGFFGNAITGADPLPAGAIGLRLDGLAAGDYLVYVMARNTNSNAIRQSDLPGGYTGGQTVSMGIHVTTGASAGTYTFDPGAPAASQENHGYSTTEYAGQFTTFIDGENYVAVPVTVGEGESLFLAVDGTGNETRGFLNAVQIVPVPEPSAALLGAFGFLGLLRRRR